MTIHEIQEHVQSKQKDRFELREELKMTRYYGSWPRNHDRTIMDVTMFTEMDQSVKDNEKEENYQDLCKEIR